MFPSILCNIEISLSYVDFESLIENPHVTPRYARTWGAIANFADTHGNGNTEGQTQVEIGNSYHISLNSIPP